MRGLRADAGDTLQERVLRLPHRTLFDPLIQIGIRLGERLFEKADVLRETAAHTRPRVLETLALRLEHLDELAATIHQRGEFSRGLVRQRARHRLHTRRIAGQQGGVEAIRFRELPHAAREVAHLPRIHHRHGQARLDTRGRQQLVIPPGRLDNDELRRERPQLREQRGHPGRIIRHLPRGAALDGHVQRLRADINADEAHGLLTRS